MLKKKRKIIVDTAESENSKNESSLIKNENAKPSDAVSKDPFQKLEKNLFEIKKKQEHSNVKIAYLEKVNENMKTDMDIFTVQLDTSKGKFDSIEDKLDTLKLKIQELKPEKHSNVCDIEVIDYNEMDTSDHHINANDFCTDSKLEENNSGLFIDSDVRMTESSKSSYTKLRRWLKKRKKPCWL